MIPRLHAVADGLPDTGWIDFSGQITTLWDDPLPILMGGLEARRYGPFVMFRTPGRLHVDHGGNRGNVMIRLPVGWRMRYQALWVTTWNSTILSVLDCETDRLRSASSPQSPWDRAVTGIGSGVTDDPFPAPPYL